MDRERGSLARARARAAALAVLLAIALAMQHADAALEGPHICTRQAA